MVCYEQLPSSVVVTFQIVSVRRGGICFLTVYLWLWALGSQRPKYLLPVPSLGSSVQIQLTPRSQSLSAFFRTCFPALDPQQERCGFGAYISVPILPSPSSPRCAAPSLAEKYVLGFWGYPASGRQLPSPLLPFFFFKSLREPRPAWVAEISSVTGSASPSPGLRP